MRVEQGWEKIAKVTPERWDDEMGFYEIVWIETVDGNLYSRSLNVGDTVEFLVKHYEKRGRTDSKCVFDRDLKADAAEASYDHFNRYIAGDR